jgi:hypothetical protein
MFPEPFRLEQVEMDRAQGSAADRLRLQEGASLERHENTKTEPSVVSLRTPLRRELCITDLKSSPRVRAEQLAELSCCATRLGRKEQADRFLLMAWLAYDEEEERERDLRSAA